MQFNGGGANTGLAHFIQEQLGGHGGGSHGGFGGGNAGFGNQWAKETPKPHSPALYPIATYTSASSVMNTS